MENYVQAFKSKTLINLILELKFPWHRETCRAQGENRAITLIVIVIVLLEYYKSVNYSNNMY